MVTGAAACVAFFLVRFDFDADAFDGVGFEEHDELGRLLQCSDGIETPPAALQEVLVLSCLEMRVSVPPWEAIVPSTYLPWPDSCAAMPSACSGNAPHALLTSERFLVFRFRLDIGT